MKVVGIINNGCGCETKLPLSWDMHYRKLYKSNLDNEQQPIMANQRRNLFDYYLNAHNIYLYTTSTPITSLIGTATQLLVRLAVGF